MADTGGPHLDLRPDYLEYFERMNQGAVPQVKTALDQDIMSHISGKNGEALAEQTRQKRIAELVLIIRSKIEQIDQNRDFALHQVKDKEDFQKTPRTKVKTAQEILTIPYERQNFSRQDVANFGNAALINRILVDPRRISEALLKAAGMDESVTAMKGLSKRDRLQMLIDLIPEIKAFFAHDIEPLSYAHEQEQSEDKQSYFRLFRIAKGKNAGMILGTQENDGKETVFMSSIHSVYRRINHIEENYSKELETLSSIQHALAGIKKRISTSWEEVKNGNELENFRAQMEEMLEVLKFVRDDHKAAIRQKIEKCTTFRDKEGKLNPSSKLAILANIESYFSKRIEETGNIFGHLSADRTRVMNHILEQANVLADFHRDVEVYNNRLILLDPKKEISEVEKDRIITHLEVIKIHCVSFEFKPYIDLGKYVISEIDEIIECLKSDRRNDVPARTEAKKSLAMIYVISKLLKFEHDMTNLRDEYFKPGAALEKIYVKGLIKRMVSIRDGFESKKIAPEMRIDDFVEIYGEIYKFLNETISILNQSLSGKAPEEKRVEALREVSELMKRFNPYKTLEA